MPSIAEDVKVTGSAAEAEPESRGPSFSSKLRRALLHALKIPVISFLSAFFTATPDWEHAQSILNIFGLVAALVMSFVVALPGTFTYADLVEADKRFGYSEDGVDMMATNGSAGCPSQGYPGYCTWWREPQPFKSKKKDPPSKEFAFYLGLTTFFVGSCLLVVVITYIYLSLAQIGGRGSDAKRTARQMKEWFSYGRWGFVVAALLLVAGMTEFFVANYYLFVLKFPDYIVAQTGQPSVHTVYGSLLGFQYGIILVILAISVIMGWANYAVFVLNANAGARVVPVAEGSEHSGEGKGEQLLLGKPRSSAALTVGSAAPGAEQLAPQGERKGHSPIADMD